MPKPINISASRGSAILGLSEWSTPVETWLKIMEARQPGFCQENNYIYPEFEDNASLRWGKAFESAVIELAEVKHEDYPYRKIIDREKIYKHKNNYITCHIDGMYEREVIDKTTLHEGKTTNYFYFKDNFGEPGTDKVPLDYQIQNQHQLICTGANKVILSVLVFPKRVDEWESQGILAELGMVGQDGHQFAHIRKIINTDEKGLHTFKENFDGVYDWAKILNQMGYFHQYEINANPELQQLMIEHYKEFWNNCVLAGKPPRPQKYDDIRALITAPHGTIVADSTIVDLWTEYKAIGKEIGATGAASKRREMIKVKLLNFLSTKNVVFDEESQDKWLILDQAGKKLFSYNGRAMR